MPKVINQKIKVNISGTDDYLLPHITFNSNCEVLVEGNRGILEYNSGKIRLNAGDCILSFSGDKLCIRNMSVDEVVITGEIVAFEFSSD